MTDPVHFIVVSTNLTSVVQRSLERAAEASGSVNMLDIRFSTVGTRAGGPLPTIGGPTVVVWRHIHPHVEHGEVLLRRLADCGAVVLNHPDVAARASNKLVMAYHLERAGVATVLTTGVTVSVPDTPGRVVVKPVRGESGIGVGLYDSSRGAVVGLTELGWHGELIVQPHLGPLGVDLRAFVVGGHCVALARRTAKPGEWRANVDLGGTMSPLPLSHAAARVAEAAAAAIGLDHCGVDLIDEPPYPVIELSGESGWRHLAPTCSVDVAAAIVDWGLTRSQGTQPGA